MKIPKFKSPGNSEHNESYLSILVLMLAVFMLVLIGIVSQGATVHAEEAFVDPVNYPYSLRIRYNQNVSNVNSYDVSSYMRGKYPFYGYCLRDNNMADIRFKMVDIDNKLTYDLNQTYTDANIYEWYFVHASRDYTNSSNVTTNSYSISNCWYSKAYSTATMVTTGDFGLMSLCSVPIFESLEALELYAETGELSGIIHEGDVSMDGRDFSGEYDPDVPIPQLKNITHNGFDVVNGSDDLELDLVVESTFYGLTHNTVGGTSKGIFLRDVSNVINTHFYDAGTLDVGFLSSKGSFNLRDDYGIENYNDLVADGAKYFLTYPTQKDLPSYNWMKHNTTVFNTAFTQQKGCYIDNGGLTEQVVSNRSIQMETKYYVRYYQINEDGTYTPGQWYSYTFGKKSDNLAYPDVVISPVGGDENGNPIDKDPVEGGQDGNGDIIITDPTDPGQWDNEGTLLSMIRDLLGNWQEMITYYQQFGSFLAITLDFIPGAIWESIILGIRISVLCMVWRFVIR